MQQQARRSGSEVADRLPDSGQRRRDECRHRHVVEARDGDVARHGIAACERANEHAEGDLVIGTDDALGDWVAALDQAFDGEDAVVLLHRDAKRPARDRNPQIAVRRPEALPAFGHVRRPGRIANEDQFAQAVHLEEVPRDRALQGIGDPAELLLTGAAIWLTNMIVFGLWYWEFDRGGPVERAAATQPYPDFVFPQMTNPELAPLEWEPGFVDYLYVSFTNAMAFSPTDAMPMTRWAKLTMLTQSLISVITLVLVIARAVNILKA